ncbi:hypothetical protein CDAR_608031 [Caerostris darwini]|uniref:Uncharacterized protein n=1 Tax=Caerostris darwini TaxID=1538125 RepID=A0AAV4UMC9_9ARAC|nr:hypothetical protein CDAR_608031 [Caerostris darwini]
MNSEDRLKKITQEDLCKPVQQYAGFCPNPNCKNHLLPDLKLNVRLGGEIYKKGGFAHRTVKIFLKENLGAFKISQKNYHLRNMKKYIVKLKVSIYTEYVIKKLIKEMYDKATTELSYAPISTKLCKYLESIRVPVRCKMKTHSGFDELLLIQCHKGFEQNKAKGIEQEETKKVFVHDENPELEMEDNEEKTKYKKLRNSMYVRQLFKFGVSVKLFAEEYFKGLSKQSIGKPFDSMYHLSKAFNALYKVSLIKNAKVISGPDSESKKNQKQLTVLTKLCEELSKDKAKSEQEIKKLKEDTQRLQMELNHVLHVMTAEEKFTLKQMRELQEIAKDVRVKLKQDLQAEQDKNVLVLEESRRENISTKEAVEIQNNNFTRKDEIHKKVEIKESPELLELFQNMTNHPGRMVEEKDRRESRNRLSDGGWASRLKSSSISICRTVDPSKQLAKIYSAAKLFTALYGVKRVFQRSSTSSQESNSEPPPAAQETPFTSEERDHANELGLSSASELKTSDNKAHLNGNISMK